MSALTIRRAAAGDGPALARLATLDCARPLAGEILLAEVCGQPAAALSLADGRVVADPFRPTAELVGLLRMRSEQLLTRLASPRR